MMKIRFGLEKRYDIYLRDLNLYLRQHLTNPEHVHKVVNRITSSAYFTIPEEFWRGAEKAHRVYNA